MTEVSSSVYATPLITDLYADGRKDIIVPGVSYVCVSRGSARAHACSLRSVLRACQDNDVTTKECIGGGCRGCAAWLFGHGQHPTLAPLRPWHPLQYRSAETAMPVRLRHMQADPLCVTLLVLFNSVFDRTGRATHKGSACMNGSYHWHDHLGLNR